MKNGSSLNRGKNVSMHIPWAVPSITRQDEQAIIHVLKSHWLSMGPEVRKFENLVSSYLKINQAVAVSSGTAALDVALKCLDIQQGDEVIIPALTFVATGSAVLYNHATPVFVDIDETLNIDVNLIEEKITDRTKAIMNIDLGGNVADYASLLKIAKDHDVALLVDGAQSFGSEDHGAMCCTQGVVNTTSFHAAKLLTTIEGGMVLTNSLRHSRRARQIRSHGESTKYMHPLLGHNYRMTDLLAALGCSQMRRFPQLLKQRRKRAQAYKEALQNVSFPVERQGTTNCYFLFPILSAQRNKLNKHLNTHGIDTRITYPLPLNEQPLFRPFHSGNYPKAKSVSQQIIALPIHNALSGEEQEYIIKTINRFKG